MSRRVVLLFVAFLLPAFAQQPAANPEYAAIRAAQPAESMVAENVVIKREGGTITLRQGTLSFTTPVQGRVTSAVFTGQGEFEFTPAVTSEARHMARLYALSAVKETFDRAVFFFTDDSYQQLKRASGQPVPPAATAALKDVRDRLRTRRDEPKSQMEALLTGEDMDNVDAEILMDLYNSKREGFFSAYMHGAKYNDLRFHVRPRGAVPQINSPEEVGLLYLNTGSDDEGIWYLAHRGEEYAAGRARSDENKWVVDVDHYKIETTVAGNRRLTAKADVGFHAVGDGDRVIKFGLLPSLRVSAVRMGSNPVPFIQEDRQHDGTLYAIMPEPMVKDRPYQLSIEYSGDKVISDAGGGNFSVEARSSWYPSVNSFTDQATYDLTYRVPRNFVLVSVGKPVSEKRDGDFTVSQWTSEVPLAVAGFNYGRFKKKETPIKELSYGLDGYATPDVPDYLKEFADDVGGISPTRLLDQALSQASVSMRIFDQWFGKAPYGHLSITEQPDFSFGQSWPGLVYLPMASFLDATIRYQLFNSINTSLNNFVQEVTPHEVSHQWWGHMVGWSSYRDQWLSEGFADFSAGVFLQLTEKNPDKYLKYLSNARDSVLNKNSYGDSPNDAGPIDMGQRLNTSRSRSAYSRLVYSKGGLVLHMLRMMMWTNKDGDKAFIAMMHDFVQTHMFKNATTESFKAIVEKHVTPEMTMTRDQKMDWFFNEWVYGTAIPKYELTYDVSNEPDGKFRLKAQVTQSGVDDAFHMPVPLYLDLDGRIVRLGVVPMNGNGPGLPIDVVLAQKPRRVMLNANYDVLVQK